MSAPDLQPFTLEPVPAVLAVLEGRNHTTTQPVLEPVPAVGELAAKRGIPAALRRLMAAPVRFEPTVTRPEIGVRPPYIVQPDQDEPGRAARLARKHWKKKKKREQDRAPVGCFEGITADAPADSYASRTTEPLWFMLWAHHHTTRGRSKLERGLDCHWRVYRPGMTEDDWKEVAPRRTIIWPPALPEYKRQKSAQLKSQVCSWCGDSFTSKRVDARYCSSKCRKAASRLEKLGRVTDSAEVAHIMRGEVKAVRTWSRTCALASPPRYQPALTRRDFGVGL